MSPAAVSLNAVMAEQSVLKDFPKEVAAGRLKVVSDLQ